MKQKILRPLLQVIFVLAVAGILIMVAGANPLKAMQIFFTGIFGSFNGIAEVLVKAAPLIFLGLGVSISFRTGFFNIGGEGQFYVGTIAATAVVFGCSALPGIVRILLAMIAAFVVGGLWAFIPAILKNKLRISETITTIMFNYIAIMLVGLVVRGPLQDASAALPQSAFLPGEASLALLAPPTRLHFGIILAVVLGVALWFITQKTTLGYEMKMVGSSQRAAHCMGLPVGRSLLISALIGGGLCGLAGMNEVLGVQHRLLEGLSGGSGYTAVLIALLARNHPLGVILVSVLHAAVQVGANTMQRQMGIPASIVSILMGLIVVMILSKDLVSIYKENQKSRKVRGGTCG